MSKAFKRQRRARRSRGEIERIIDEYRGSGLSQVAFARERNLNLRTFRKWLAKERVMRGPALREVTVPFGPAERMTVRLPGAIELEVPARADSAWVLKVARGLQE